MNGDGMPLNIPVGGEGDGPRNNPNRPAWTQVSQLFANAVLPAVCMGIAGFFATRCLKLSVQLHQAKKTEEEVLNTVDKKDLAKLQKDLENSKSEVAHLQFLLSQSVGKSKAADWMKMLEHERESQRKALTKSLKARQSDILDILDIACSPIKNRDGRTVLQQKLVDNVSHPSSILTPIHMAPDLVEIFEHDTRFCGSDKSQNGKIWRIYAKLWEEKAEKMKYKHAWEDLKRAFASSS